MDIREDTVIYRPQYLEKIKPFINKDIIKVLTGQRRVGKSYVLLECINYIKSEKPDANIIYIDLDDINFLHIKNANDLHEYVKKRLEFGKTNYLFIDEVQDIDGFENVLRSYVANGTCDIYITGSNAKMLSGELATYLSGRYVEIPIHALSYKEFLQFHKLGDSDETLRKYLTYGGLPYLIHLKLKDEIVFEYLKNVCSTILFKDVLQREKLRNAVFLETLATYVAGNTGNIFSANNISKYLKSQNTKINVPQIINYLQAFSNAHLIHKVPRAEIEGMRVFEVGEKYFFEDLGLRNTLVSFDFSKDIGKLIENAVYNHMARLGWKIFVGRIGEHEIDFVCTKRDKKIYIQAAYLTHDEESRKREFGNLRRIKDNYPKYVVSLDPLLTSSNSQGIAHVHLRKFLMME